MCKTINIYNTKYSYFKIETYKLLTKKTRSLFNVQCVIILHNNSIGNNNIQNVVSLKIKRSLRVECRTKTELWMFGLFVIFCIYFCFFCMMLEKWNKKVFHSYFLLCSPLFHHVSSHHPKALLSLHLLHPSLLHTNDVIC